MKYFLEGNKFYVINGENLVYEVNGFEAYSASTALYIDLELVAGLDYVNPDISDVQDWVGADNFVDDVQFETVAQYFLKEGMEEALEANGYTILKEIDFNLQAIIDKHNEF